MEKFESNIPERNKISRDFIVEGLNLVTDDKAESKGFLKLKSNPITEVETSENDIERKERVLLDSPEKFGAYFEGIDIENPDKMCRPKGDTTYFTTAGVQRIETILREEGKLERRKFVIAQPSIRSQFMDKVKDGTSTSFVNLSVESIVSTPDEFIDLSNQLIKMVIDQGASRDGLEFKIEEVFDKWGDRKFTKTVLTIYFKETEVGECVYIHDYSSSKTEKVAVSDISFGVERLNWALGNSINYFPEFNDFYSETVDSNKITSVIDCIRTAVLMAGEGIKPSHHDPGYRLRQLLKRFVSRNQIIDFDATKLARTAFAYWEKWGFKPSVPIDEVVEIINLENVRSYNVLILSMLEKEGGPRININVSQPTNRLLEQINRSLPKEIVSAINNIIKKIK